ncbi:hypothetical protein BJV74DRAFT_798408 [Russula compacta]|nr:hypothetical protein BJV74DRAFT_798408 [Russula compacta]
MWRQPFPFAFGVKCEASRRMPACWSKGRVSYTCEHSTIIKGDEQLRPPAIDHAQHRSHEDPAWIEQHAKILIREMVPSGSQKSSQGDLLPGVQRGIGGKLLFPARIRLHVGSGEGSQENIQFTLDHGQEIKDRLVVQLHGICDVVYPSVF